MSSTHVSLADMRRKYDHALSTGHVQLTAEMLSRWISEVEVLQNRADNLRWGLDTIAEPDPPDISDDKLIDAALEKVERLKDQASELRT